MYIVTWKQTNRNRHVDTYGYTVMFRHMNIDTDIWKWTQVHGHVDMVIDIWTLSHEHPQTYAQ